MEQFTNKLFQSKSAYEFRSQDKDLKELLNQDLTRQLSDLEQRWLTYWMEKPYNTIDQAAIEHALFLGRLEFRLEELVSFVETFLAPQIIKFVCSEVKDLLGHKALTSSPLKESEVRNVSSILIAVNGYFNAEVQSLELDHEEMAKALHRSIADLLEGMWDASGDEKHRWPSVLS